MEARVNWSQLERQQPRLARLGAERLIDPGVLLIGTIRQDGTPRLSAVEPYVMDGALWLSMLWGSTKAADLLRDPRILVHSIITNRDGGAGEFKLRGKARSESDVTTQRSYADAVSQALGWQPVPGRFHLFEIDIEDVTYLRFDHATGDQHGARWPAGREFVRRATTPTSLGAPEPASDILLAS
jgi:hypothetical protein